MEVGIVFDDYADRPLFLRIILPTAKPRTGMLGKYLAGEYDFGKRYVIGDRLTDMELAANLGAKDAYRLRPSG